MPFIYPFSSAAMHDVPTKKRRSPALLRSAFFLSLSFALLTGPMACNNTDTTPGRPSVSQRGSLSNYKEGRDYLLFERVRTLDKVGFAQPAEAFSMLVPKGWHHEGEVMWTANGSGCDGTNQRFKATSADGKFSLEIFPASLWSWTTNQQLQQFYQQNPVTSSYCSYGPPMDAEQYLRKVFAPGELGNPAITAVKPDPLVVQGMQQSNEKGRQEMMSYGASDVQYHQSAIHANLRWPDNTEGIALCGVSIAEVTVPNVYNGTYDKQTTSQAVQRIVFRYPAGEGDRAAQMLSVMMSSFRTNPSWMEAVNGFWRNARQQKQRVHLGKIRMMDEQTRAIGEAAIRKGAERLKSMDNDLRNWEERQQAQDRAHTNFIKAIREVETYRDETGRVELSSGYDHAWSRGDGTSYIMSDNPNFDPAAVFLDQQWKEMKKVD